MLDFSNLTTEQEAFFNDLWENNKRESEQSTESLKDINAYIAHRRQQEQSQAKAAEVIKSKMV